MDGLSVSYLWHFEQPTQDGDNCTLVGFLFFFEPDELYDVMYTSIEAPAWRADINATTPRGCFSFFRERG